MKKLQTKKGFTLLELLLVIALIAILASIVIIAINPAKQLAEGRNAQRRSDVNTILNGIYQYAIDNNGTIPGNASTTATAICQTGGTCTGLIDLSAITNDEKYLVSMPADPSTATTNSTNYTMSKSANGRITIAAPGGAAETSAPATITVTR